MRFVPQFEKGALRDIDFENKTIRAHVVGHRCDIYR